MPPCDGVRALSVGGREDDARAHDEAMRQRLPAGAALELGAELVRQRKRSRGWCRHRASRCTGRLRRHHSHVTRQRIFVGQSAIAQQTNSDKHTRCQCELRGPNTSPRSSDRASAVRASQRLSERCAELSRRRPGAVVSSSAWLAASYFPAGRRRIRGRAVRAGVHGQPCCHSASSKRNRTGRSGRHARSRYTRLLPV